MSTVPCVCAAVALEALPSAVAVAFPPVTVWPTEPAIQQLNFYEIV